MNIAAAPATAIQIVFQVAITSGHITHRLLRGVRQRRSPQIGVDDDPRGIDDRD